jgi:twitching motility protein PilU
MADTNKSASFLPFDQLLQRFVELKGSDMYLTVGCPPSVRLSDSIVPVTQQPLEEVDIERFISEMLSDEQRKEFYANMEYNIPFPWRESTRFRVNLFRQ